MKSTLLQIAAEEKRLAKSPSSRAGQHGVGAKIAKRMKERYGERFPDAYSCYIREVEDVLRVLKRGGFF